MGNGLRGESAVLGRGKRGQRRLQSRDRLSPRTLRLEPLECRRLLALTTELRFEFDPAGGGAAVASLTVGQDYVLKAFVQDIRSPQPATPGLRQAYFNITYDSSLVTVGAIMHGADFDLNSAGDTSVAGTLSTIGGADTDQVPPAPNTEELLFSLPVHADQQGMLTLTPNITTDLLKQVLLFNSASSVPWSDIDATLNGSNSLEIDVNPAGPPVNHARLAPTMPSPPSKTRRTYSRPPTSASATPTTRRQTI